MKRRIGPMFIIVTSLILSSIATIVAGTGLFNKALDSLGNDSIRDRIFALSPTLLTVLGGLILGFGFAFYSVAGIASISRMGDESDLRKNRARAFGTFALSYMRAVLRAWLGRGFVRWVGSGRVPVVWWVCWRTRIGVRTHFAS